MEELQIGTHFNLKNYYCGTSTPYTVIARPSECRAVARKCHMVFPNPCYYDTLPLAIFEGREGIEEEIVLTKTKSGWQEKGNKYDAVRVGDWKYSPYLD